MLAPSISCKRTGAAIPDRVAAPDARTAAILIGRSSNEFHCSHCGQRPSQRGDSNPQVEQKNTERVFATSGASAEAPPTPRLNSGAVPTAGVQVAIDGPAASGKTTVARRVADALGFLYLDTGAMYRALAWLALHTETHVDNQAALARLCRTSPVRVELDRTAPMGFRVLAGERELAREQLESSEVTSVVSIVAAHPLVREAMVEEQRRIADRSSVVMAGRDIGSVVLANATVKIFLTASVEARVRRRRAQLEAAGIDLHAHELVTEVRERDRMDEERTVSPLRKAPDALEIDSSDLSIDDVVARICDIVRSRT